MLSTTALILVSSLGGFQVSAATPHLDAPTELHVRTPDGAPGDSARPLSLRSPLLAASESLRVRPMARLAQAPATAPGTTPTPSGGDAAAEAAANATPPPAEEPEPSIDLLRQRASLTRTHRPLGIATWASLLATVGLGTISAINQRTAFGAGLCNSQDARGVVHPIFDTFGCSSLSQVHEFAAFATVALYTATGIFALSMPDPEHAGTGNDRRGSTLRLHRTMAFIHLAGMASLPLLGILSAHPGILGINDSSGDFASAMRTVHLGIGYVTLAALTTAMILEL